MEVIFFNIFISAFNSSITFFGSVIFSLSKLLRVMVFSRIYGTVTVPLPLII
jgi:hypothetical protein